ncbi:MAG: hypothetical protein IJB71_00175 [Bacilli bacterium]|nr:hypothetical protein [Bacilli bacterium]
MKNKQKKAQKSYLYIIFLALAFIILLGTGAYAYYQTTITGSITGSVAQWSFKANDQTSTFNINLGDLYPGKYVEYGIDLSTENSELPVGFLLIFNSPQLYDAELNPIFSAEYKVFYRNSFIFNYTREDRTDGAAQMLMVAGIYGIIMPGSKITIPLYYDWPHDGQIDDYNTLANTQNITAPITIVGRQLDMTSEETIFSTLDQFMDDYVNSISCTNGTYPYPNKYGYSCTNEPFYVYDISNGLQLGNALISMITAY